MIRHDLFAVRVFQDVGATKGKWVTERIARSRRTANNYRSFTASDRHRTFSLVKPKLVHPSQDTVDAFVLVGNTIED